MRKKTAILAGVLLIASCTLFAQAKQTKINIDFNGVDSPFTLSTLETSISVKPQSTTITLDIKYPQYVKMARTNIAEYIYVCPGDEINMKVTGKARGEVTFTGSNAKINTFLADVENSPRVTGIGGEEKDFIDRLTKNVEATTLRLKSHSFDDNFTKIEQKRIWSKIYTSLVSYPSLRKRTDRSYRPSEYFYNFVKSVTFEQADLLILDEYKSLLEYLVQLYAIKDILKYDAYEYSITTLNYVVNNIKDPAVKRYLVNYYAYDYLKRHGTEKIEKISDIFYKVVTDSKEIKRYNETVETWSKIAKGTKIQEYEFHDIDGKSVMLSSFMGKYVYIDMWATWCKPCIAEIPHLKKLEHALEGANIVFVSISTDKDAVAWKNMVVKDEMKGVQLHARKRDFSNDFLFVSIPRFILLDPQGRVVEHNMLRPSNAQTLPYLQLLLK